MLGDILSDLAEALLEGLIPGADSVRGLFLAISSITLAAEAWAFLRVPDPLRGSDWTVAAIVVGAFWSFPGLLFGLIHAVRGDEDRLLGWTTLFVSLARSPGRSPHSGNSDDSIRTESSAPGDAR